MEQIRKFLLVAMMSSMICAPLMARTNEVIHVKGSDTMVIVAQSWAEEYEKVNPAVIVSVAGGGSGTGIDAMLNGTVEIADSSRRMASGELKRAQRLGMNPVEHIVGYDALAVYVHAQNPIELLSLAQIAEIFGEQGKIKKWTDLGIQVPGCQGQKIVRAGRQNNSGTYVYFSQAALGKGRDYDLGILDLLSSKDVVHLVEKTPCAIGYSGMAYATPKVKMLCIKKTKLESCVTPSEASAVDNSYPIARPLFMYTKDTPTGEIKTYLDWILSDRGQCILKRGGYAPVRPVQCD